MKLRYLLSALTLPVVLSACGLAGAIIGPVEVGDALGVNGKALSATFAGGADGNLLALSTDALSTATGSAEYSFDDQELKTRGFNLVDVKAEVGIEATVVLRAPLGETSYPESFTLSAVEAEATVGDEVNGSVTLKESRGLELTFKKGTCSATSCDYIFEGDAVLLADALSVREGDNSLLRKFVKIIKLDDSNSPNSGSFSVVLSAESDADLAGFKATFKLINKSTKIRVG